MNYLLLIMVAAGVSVQQVAKKAYNMRVSGGVYSFTAASALVAVMVFIVTSGGKLEFTPQLFGYSVTFAVSYCVAAVSSFLAIYFGSLSLSSLVMQYSLIIPAFYGFVALGEPLKATLFVGIAVLLVSLLLINFEGAEEKKINLKWCIFALLAFCGNGACSAIQKVQQLEFGGKGKSELMIVALLITVVVLLVMALFTEKKNTLHNLKKGSGWFVICGLANGIVNYLVLTLSNRMPASVMFPVISAGGIVLTALISIFVYKEKLSAQQKLGLILGVIAIVILNV